MDGYNLKKFKNAKYLFINKFYFILADWGDLQEIAYIIDYLLYNLQYNLQYKIY